MYKNIATMLITIHSATQLNLLFKYNITKKIINHNYVILKLL